MLDTNVQIVANYLNLLQTDKKGLNTKDVYFEGINPSFKDFKSRIDAKILSQEKCQELIFERIRRKIPNPNYYQITSFINALGTQLRKFSQNILLSAMNLNDKNPKVQYYKHLEGIRSFVIENFIEFTTYFTEGGFIDLVNNQMRNYRQAIGNFDEDKDNEEAIQNLAKVDEANMTSFDKLKRTLLLFAEGNGEGLSIISNLQDKNENDKYSALMRTQNSKIPILSDNNNQKIFLEQLRIILNINNEIGKSTD